MNSLSVTTSPIADEILTAQQWSEILGISDREIRKVGCTLSRRELKPKWRNTVNELMVQHSVVSCHDLLRALRGIQVGWEPRKKFTELLPEAQERAEKVRAVLAVYYQSRKLGRGKTESCRMAMDQWLAQFGETVTDRTIREWVKRINLRGGPDAPLEAYADGRNGSAKPRKGLPPDFARDVVARFLESDKGVRSAANILAEYQARWDRGEEIPGLGSRHGAEQLPVTRAQIQKCAPSRASREIVGRGKFLAKTTGYIAAPPLDWSEVEPCRVVFFDDKVLNVQVMTDDGMKSFRPHIYIAYCGGTRRVLAFIVREENRMTQLDVEGLQAAVLRDHGFGGPLVGWKTRWVKERGTISISDARRDLIQSIFPDHIEIDRTMMIGGKASPGDWVQKGSGNFFGKAVLEAFMGSLDHFAKMLPAQTGNRYDNQPAVLGDTTLTLKQIINSARQGHRPARSLLEEGILTAAMARMLDWMETGEHVSAWEASHRQGIPSPVLFYTDFVAALGELFRAFNNRRGHRMQGFGMVRVPHPNLDKMVEVSESPNDKAERMFGTMTLQGRRLVRPHEADIAALLHKIKRVTVNPSGCVTEKMTYWHEMSNACREASAVQGARKTYLALYNPISPSALYLLANPPSHLPANATEIPTGFRPQLYEVLPLYKAPSPVDDEALAKRTESVGNFNARASREIVLHNEQLLMERAARQEQLRDRLEPLRATIRSAAPPEAPETLAPSDLGGQLARAEEVTRSGQRAQTEQTYAESLPLNETSEY